MMGLYRGKREWRSPARGMVRVGVQLIQDPRLLAELRSLPDNVQRRALRPCLTASTKIILQSVKSLVPVDTGALKKNIKAKSGKRSRKGLSRFVWLPPRESLGIDSTSKWYYPAHLEYGTSKMPAKPFLRPGFDRAEQQAINAFNNQLQLEIAKILGG